LTRSGSDTDRLRGFLEDRLHPSRSDPEPSREANDRVRARFLQAPLDPADRGDIDFSQDGDGLEGEASLPP
jgi:hypothetical protein